MDTRIYAGVRVHGAQRWMLSRIFLNHSLHSFSKAVPLLNLDQADLALSFGGWGDHPVSDFSALG